MVIEEGKLQGTMIKRRLIRVAVPLLVVALLLGVGGAALATWAGEASVDIGAGAGCNVVFPLPTWIYWAGWGGIVLTASAILVTLIARAMVPRRDSWLLLRDILPALVAASVVLFGLNAGTDYAATQIAGYSVDLLTLSLAVVLHLATRNAAPQPPARRLLRWALPIILAISVVAFLLALEALDSIFLNTPGEYICGG